jgi:hypothetical protein
MPITTLWPRASRWERAGRKTVTSEASRKAVRAGWRLFEALRDRKLPFG